MNTARKRFFIFFLFLSLVVTSCAIFQPENEDQPLTATGYLSANEVKVASELAGKVAGVHVVEGEFVEAGDVLFELDDALLTAELERAQTRVESAAINLTAAEEQVAAAEIHYQMALQQARDQEWKLAFQPWMEESGEEIDLPSWYFQKREQMQTLENEIQEAEDQVDTSLRKLDGVLGETSYEDFLRLEEELHRKQTAYQSASFILDQAQNSPEKEYLLDAAEEMVDTAEAELDAAQLAFDQEIDETKAEEVLDARAKVAIAQANLDHLRELSRRYETGEDSLQVKAARKAYEQSVVAVDQAQAQVEEAEAGLALIELQLEKTRTVSPMSGTILSLDISKGEIITPGSPVMTVADLDTLELVVYLPEDRYGRVQLGETVDIKVDSYPAEVFPGEVTFISDQAEFTPRNVQTPEGRKSTVYAVKIVVENPQNKLKPGMPTDVTFGG